MIFHKFASFLGFVLFALLVPCLAQAQDDASPSLEEKFGGWYISGDISIGTAPYGDTSSEPAYRQEDYYRYGSNYRSYERELWSDTQFVSGGLQLQAGYLFGSRVFVGPEITVGFGVPSFITADGRVRLVAPIHDGHAFDAAVGLGFVGGNPVAAEDHETPAYEYLYIPVQMGYNYTYDNGFMIGVSLQLNITFAQEDGEDAGAFLGWWGIGLRLGYRFGHHE